MNHQSSARKKLLQYEQDLKQQQIRSGVFERTQSRQHSKFMQSILRQNIEKQQSDRALRREYSTKNYSSVSKTPSSNRHKLNDLQLSKLDSVKFKPLLTSKSNQFDLAIKVQEDGDPVLASKLPQFLTDTDQVRSARQNQLLQVKTIPFTFSFWSYLAEVALGYGLTFGLLYLIQATDFPCYQLILIFVLTLAITPWKTSNLIVILTAVPITIVNNYMGLKMLTYAQIFVCFIAVMIFNQKYKIKVLFIVVLAVQLMFGFVFLRIIYRILFSNTKIYYYLYPLFVFILRNFVQLLYWIMGHSTGLFLQIPLFIIGLEYGIVLSISISQIQFWYLIVFFTLQIMNDRTHFLLKVMVNLVKYCFPSMNATPGQQKKNNHILPAHWNGFSCIHSFHLVICVYIFTELKLYASPYASTFNLSTYTSNGEWYKPLIIWCLVSIYEIMCLILKRNKRNVLLIGYVNNSWYSTIIRGLTLVLGLWLFYLGLGIGSYLVQSFV